MKKLNFFILPFLVLLTACHQNPASSENGLRDTVLVAWDDPHILAMGRINTQGPEDAILYWPGTSLTIRFRGEKAEALLEDERGDNYYDVVIDGGNPRLLRMDSVKRWYLLTDSLPEGEHTLQIFKRSEWTRGHTKFYAFRITGRAKLPDPPATFGKVIEFFGNSITAGYAAHDTVDDHPDSTLTDNYVTYAALTARHYHAGYYCTSRSGIGFMISWFPMIMPEMYDRLDPEDPQSKWDFSGVQPGIVVINLGQNDSWLIEDPEYPEFKHRFGNKKPTPRQIMNAYKDFVRKIRAVYPQAQIICALGSMDAVKEGSPWPGYVRTAVKEMNDPAIHTLIFPYLGKDGHPKVEDHKVMADTLIRYIDRNIKW
jgi:hypothetical protein